ncbi:MAG: calcium-binding protein [Desulfobacteraceae bacterium]|nr:LEPR-XLL domain-containing protein [Desulfobacteraceae bacterium]MBC2755137.1 calcium-binding protein [Desulfobacteraceae bacterium]
MGRKKSFSRRRKINNTDFPKKRKLHFETLEPRLLLSADTLIPGIAGALGDGLTEMADRLDGFIDSETSFESYVPGVLWFDFPGQSEETGDYVTPTIEDLIQLEVADRDQDGSIDNESVENPPAYEAQILPDKLYVGNDFSTADGDGASPLVHDPANGLNLDLSDPLNVWHLISGDYYYAHAGVLWWSYVPSAEVALSAMDMDDSGAVDWNEAFDILVVGQIQDWMDNSDAQYYPDYYRIHGIDPTGSWGSPVTNVWADFNDQKGWPSSENKTVSEFLSELDTFLETGLEAPAALVANHAYHSAYPSDQLLSTSGQSLIEVDINSVDTTNLGPGIKLELSDVKIVFQHDFVIDLGHQADQLSIAVGTEKAVGPDGFAPPGLDAYELQLEAGVYFDDLIIGLQGYEAQQIPNPSPPPDYIASPDGTPTGPTDKYDFFFTVPDGALHIGVMADQSNIDTDVNVGFLGTSTSTGQFLLDMDVETVFHDPSHPDALGFDTLPVSGTTTLIAVDTPEGAQLDTPDYTLPSNVIFTLQIGEHNTPTYTSPYSQVVVEASNTGDNGNLGHLVADVNTALSSAAPFGLSGLITASESDGKIALSLQDTDITPLGFDSNELFASSGNDITATGVPSILGETTSRTVSFLLSAGSDLPEVVTVTTTPVDDTDNELTLDGLIDDINDALVNAGLQWSVGFFDLGVRANSVNNGSDDVVELSWYNLMIPFARSLEITRTLTLDAENVITYDELHNATVDELLSGEKDPAASLEIILPLKAKLGLKDISDNDYRPEATLKVDIDPFNDIEPVDLEGQYRPEFDVTNAVGKPLLDILADMADENVLPANWSPGDTEWPEMLDFTVISANGVIGGLSQLQSWLERLPDTELLANYAIPFTQAVLGDVLDFADVLEDALLINDGDDGLQAKPGADDTADTNKLLAWLKEGDDANLVVTFDTAQELASRLDTLLSGAINPIFDAATSELTYDIALSHSFADVPVPADFNLDLSPLADLYTESTLYVGVDGYLAATLGFKLGNALQAIDDDTTLDEAGGLNGGKGVPISDMLAVTGVKDVSSYVGRLSTNAVFTVVVTPDTGPDVNATVTVPKSETDNNVILADLIGDINLALQSAKLSDDSTVNLFSVYGISAEAVGDRVRLMTADSGVLGFRVNARATATAYTELGIQPENAVTVSLNSAVPAAVQLAENKTFSVTLYEGATSDTYNVTVLKSDTDDNRTVTDLVNDINASMDSTLLDRFVASRDGNQIVYGAIDPDVNYFTMEAETAIPVLGIDYQWLEVRGDTDVALNGQLTADQGFVLVITPSADNSADILVQIDVAAADTDTNTTIEDLVADLNHSLYDMTGGKVVAVADGQRMVLRAASTTVKHFMMTSGTLDYLELGFNETGEFFDPDDGGFYLAKAVKSTGVQLIGDADIPVPYFGQFGTDPNADIRDLVTDLNAALETAGLGNLILADSAGLKLVLRAVNPSVLAFSVTGGTTQLGILTGQTADANLSILANKAAPQYYGPGGEATFTVAFTGGTLNGQSYDVTLGAVDPATGRADYLDNTSIYSLVSDVNRALSQAVPTGGGTATDLRSYVAASNDGHRLVIMQAESVTIGTEYAGFSVKALSATDPAATDLNLVQDPKLDTVFDPQPSDGSVTADSADMLIYTQDGKVYRVTLDDAATMGNVASKIFDQTNNNVTLNDSPGTAINLRDSSSGSALFHADTVNRSGAAISLGVFGADTTTVDETPDGIIEGQQIATIKLADRLFLRPLGSSPFMSAGVSVSSDDPTTVDDPATTEVDESIDKIEAVGAFGFVGVKLEGPYDTSVTGDWTDAAFDPVLYTGGLFSNLDKSELTLTEMFKGLTAEDSLTKKVLPGTIDELTDVITQPLFLGSAEFGMLATLDGDISGMANPLNLGDGKIVIDLDDLGDAFEDPPYVSLGDPGSSVVLSSDYTFEVAIDGGVTRKVTVLADNTDGDNTDIATGGGSVNTTLADLVADFNYALEQAKLNDYIVAAEGSLLLQGASPFSGIRFDVTPLTGLPGWLPSGVTAGDTLAAIDPGLPTVDLLDSAGAQFVTALGNLGDFQDIAFDEVMNALKGLMDFLNEFDTSFDFFNTEIPFLGLSFDDVLGFVDPLKAAVQDIQQNPAGSLQALAQKIRENFGLPDFSKAADSTAAMASYFNQFGITNPTDVLSIDFDTLGGDDILRLDLRLPVGFKKALDVDLDLGDLSGVDLGPLSLQGAAGLGATGYVDAKLAFGINLDTGDVYLYENDTSIAGSLKAYSDTLTFNAALGPLGLFITGGTARVDMGFDFSGATGGWVSLADAASVFGDFDLNGITTPMINATLPLYFPTDSDYLGDIRFNPTVSLTGGDFAFDNLIPYVPDLSSIDFSNLSLFDNIGLTIDALDLFLEQTQNFLYGEVFGIDLPFIGDKLAAGGDFIEGVRSQVIKPFRELVENAPQVGGDLVQNFLFTILGPGGDVWDLSDGAIYYNAFHSLPGLGKLVDPTDGTPVDWDTFNPGNVDSDTADDYITFTWDGQDTANNWMDDQIQWDFRLGDRFTPDIDLGFDIGFPALGLESDATLNLQLLWDLAIGIGVNRTDGAYIDIDNPRKLDVAGTPGSATDDIDVADELYLRADAWFDPGQRLSGKLAFLQVDIFSLGDSTPDSPSTAYTDFRSRFNVDGTWDNFDQAYINPSSGNLEPRTDAGGDTAEDDTRLTAIFQVDLYNADDTATEKDERLGFSELGKLRVDVDLAAEAEVNLGLVAKFNEDIIPDAVAALLPEVGAQFVLDWETGDLTDGFEMSEWLELVEFRHVSIDMGSFLGDFLGPVVEKIQEITDPLQPIIDVLTARIPVVSDLAGRTITLVDIAGLTGYVEPAMIYAIADIISLVNSIPAEPGSLMLPLGGFGIVSPGTPDELKLNLTLPDFDLGSDTSGVGGFSLQDALGGFQDSLDTVLSGIDTSGSTGSTSTSVLQGTAPGAGNFAFPIFETPSEVFGLLLGRPATLITYDLPPFGMDFQWRQSFPVWGPFFVVLTIGAGVEVDLAFGYDTEGVSRFVEGDFSNPLDLLAGFFVSDTDLPQGTGGTDVPELVLEGEVFAGAELNLGIASAGVEGGLILTVNFDLFDPNRDGKVRVDEMLGAFLYEARVGNPVLAPVAIFDVYGDISAQLRAYIKALFFEYQFDITPPITLFEFEIPFDREPILATERGDGSLLLHTGPNSGSRLNGNTTDFGEEIHVASIGGGDVKVWSGQQLGVLQNAAQVYKANQIVAYGGQGDDSIYLDLGSSGITYNIEGGSGDDVIKVTGGTGSGLIHGDLGNDTITGGGGADVIYGDQGNDTIDGGAGNDIVFGDNGTLIYDTDGQTRKRLFALPDDKDGDDHLLGGADEDVLIGGGGNDWLEGGANNDLLIGDGVIIEFESGALPTAISTPAPVNGRIDDSGILKLRVTDTGSGGNDRLFGQGGEDVMYGGYGYDFLHGGDGRDQLRGETGMDTLYGGGGADLMMGGAHDDIMFGDEDPFADADDSDPTGTDLGDTIFGEDGNDYIRGQDGADYIYGNRGADIIFGDAGDDVIEGGINPDIIFGGSDDDTIDGEAGNDIVFGDDGLVAFFEFYTPVDASQLVADGVLRDVNDIGSLVRVSANGDRLIGDGGATSGALTALIGTFTDDGLNETMDLIITEVDVDDGGDGDGADGDDTINGGAGNDIVLGGAGNDWIGGDIAPADSGALPAINPIGEDVLIGDGGRIELYSRLYRMIMSIPDASSIGIDHIFGDNGNDIAFGGTSGDFIYGGHGSGRASVEQVEGEFLDADILLGDNGVINLDFGNVRQVYTSDVTDQDDGSANTGGDDTIEGNEADDIIFGGVNGSPDVLYGNTGDDILLGDNGLLDFGLDPVELVGTADVSLGEMDALTFYVTRYDDTVPVKVTIGAGDYTDNLAGLVTAINAALANGETSEAVPVSVDLSSDIVASADGDRIKFARETGSTIQSFLIAAAVDNPLGLAPIQTGPEFGTLELIVSEPYEVTDRDPYTIDDTNILGGDDTISGNEGVDVAIGGVGGDTIYGDNEDADAAAGDGDDILLGDNARIELFGTNGRLIVFGTAVDFITTTDTEELTGGPDTIEGNAGYDIVIGGVNNDDGSGDPEKDFLYGDRYAPMGTTIGNDRDDILLGDNGLLDFTYLSDSDRNTLDLIRSFEDDLGGIDDISGNAGTDLAIGGTDGDDIYGDDDSASATASDADDMLLGDNADVFLVAAPDPLPSEMGDLKLVLDAAVETIKTTDEAHPEYGGSDTISGNATDDIIAGGVFGDTLYGDRSSPNPTTIANEGNDIILGDNGAFEWLSDGRLSEVTGIDIEANNADLYEWFTDEYGIPVDDTDLTTLDLVTTEQPTSGGRDLIYGDEGQDFVFGGTDADTIFGDDGNLDEVADSSNNDLLFGDHGRIYTQFSTLPDFNARNFFVIDIDDADGGEGDRMWGEEGDDTMLGQQGDDRMYGGSGDDDMTGGHNVAGGYDELTAPAIDASLTTAIQVPDIDDVNDLMDGGTGDDSMAGDNAIIWRRGDDLSPRFRELTADAIYTTTVDTISVNISGEWQSDPADAVGRDIELVDHSDAVQTDPQGRFGVDVLAGGADSDVMFGELANDLMQGDGAIEATTVAAPFLSYELEVTDTGSPDTGDTLYFNIPELASDTDDYMEGNGGDDLMYGGLGQDDMIGGSSELFGLTTEGMRPDGSDVIFGGAGIAIARNDIGATTEGLASEDGETHVITTEPDGHARDADFIMGDNANVYRLVDEPQDVFLDFYYDDIYGLQVIPRAMEQLDYTLGGADYEGGTYSDEGVANADNGAADLIHGESGDDIIFGMTGSDLIFGEGQDDSIVGGYGHDWISGGTGQDGVLGDDGLIYTSRNSVLGEPLYGIDGLLDRDPRPKYADGNVLDEVIKTPGEIQYAVINRSGELKKTVDLVPFSFDPTWMAMDDEFPDNQDDSPYADDIIFGGLGSDWLHGGSGDDAISGAEALEHAFVPTYEPDGVLDLGYEMVALPSPVNPGNVLAFNPVDEDGQHLNNRFRAGEFALYDEYDPLQKIMLDSNGELWKSSDQGTAYEFLLNFDKSEGVVRPEGTVPKATGQQTDTYPEVNDDGKDAIFGDLGNDWLVGGTGRDDMYGGWGNDLMNADDDQTTLGDDGVTVGANDLPDTHPTYEDRAYGGAGRDVLIANTGGDRLIDWVGEYNSYLVPYAPFGMATVSRTLQPFLPDFLYALSAGDGADPTRHDDTGANPLRNGEPDAEMGLVLQKDFAWHDQTGPPADPQAGNIPGGKRDVLRSAGFNDGTTGAMFADSGVWEVEEGAMTVTAKTIGEDAVSVLDLDDYLPSYFEVAATLTMEKPTSGWKANAYVIFDYQSSTDFKFAGIDASRDKIQLGHRTAEGWIIDAETPSKIKPGEYYNVLVAVNGTNVTVVVDGTEYFSHTYTARVDADGWVYGLNAGMVGLGSDNSRGTFDNIAVQVLPPDYTFEATEDFEDADMAFLTVPQSGDWIMADGSYNGIPVGGDLAVSLVDLGLRSGLAANSILDLAATVNTDATTGIVFDYYDSDDFKYAGLSADGDTVIIGHYRSGKWVVEASIDVEIEVGNDYEIALSLKGTTVDLSLKSVGAANWQANVGHVFNAVTVDGAFGLLAKEGAAIFNTLTVKTDDPDF